MAEAPRERNRPQVPTVDDDSDHDSVRVTPDRIPRRRHDREHRERRRERDERRDNRPVPC